MKDKNKIYKLQIKKYIIYKKGNSKIREKRKKSGLNKVIHKWKKRKERGRKRKKEA